MAGRSAGRSLPVGPPTVPVHHVGLHTDGTGPIDQVMISSNPVTQDMITS